MAESTSQQSLKWDVEHKSPHIYRKTLMVKSETANGQSTNRETSRQSQGMSSERTRGSCEEGTPLSKMMGSVRSDSLKSNCKTSVKPHQSSGQLQARREMRRDSNLYNAAHDKTSRNSSSSVKMPSWTIVSPQGPELAHHVGAVIRDRFYVHGGIDKKASTKPLGKMYVMDMPSGMWLEVHAARCPALSHHACLALDDRYLVLVGGWNGHKRCTDVFVYDVQEECWMVMSSSGFPVTGGLSSHAVVQIDTGDLLMIGREGSARIQRRMSHAYLMHGSVLKKRFVYEEQALSPASRSGHTMHFLPGNLLCIIGGRATDPIELVRGFNPKSSSTKTTGGLVGRLRDLCRDSIEPCAAGKIPCGRKNHVSVAGAGAVFIHGGETFDGKCREPVGEMLLVVTRPSLQWYRLGTTPEGRAGHVCVQYEGDIFIHGGEGARRVVYGATYKLSV